ncbi:MAG TPA: formate acetyltransferase, partial [Salinimicrobium catena]|nr:formate acetyltransferase [Salinimicrobium catena]
MKTISKQTGFSFATGSWTKKIDVRDFVIKNITPYYGDAAFLKGASGKTQKLWQICLQAMREERENGGCRAIDTETISGITSHGPGFIDKDLEVIVGLQTDELLKRAMKPFGGYRVVEGAVKEKGLQVSPRVTEIFNYTKDHNNAVFSAYDAEIRDYRSYGILTGLPDNYARGRIIGDYRRVALYGIDRLIEAKEVDKITVSGEMTDHKIRLREEISDQILALEEMKKLGQLYQLDLG